MKFIIYYYYYFCNNLNENDLLNHINIPAAGAHPRYNPLLPSPSLLNLATPEIKVFEKSGLTYIKILSFICKKKK